MWATEAKMTRAERREESKRLRKEAKKSVQKMRRLVPADHPALSTVCSPAVIGPETTQLALELTGVLVATPNGVGLAAPQIGTAARVIVIWPSRFGHLNAQGQLPAGRATATLESPMVMANPEYVFRDTEMVDSPEMCLSYPGVRATVKRHKRIIVRWWTLAGEKAEAEFSGFAGIVVQHEMDHLEGACPLRIEAPPVDPSDAPPL